MAGHSGWSHSGTDVYRPACVCVCARDTLCAHLLERVLSGGSQAKETETR